MVGIGPQLGEIWGFENGRFWFENWHFCQFRPTVPPKTGSQISDFSTPFARTSGPLSMLRTRARGLFTVSRKVRSNLAKNQFRRISPDMLEMRYLAKYISASELAVPGLLSV